MAARESGVLFESPVTMAPRLRSRSAATPSSLSITGGPAMPRAEAMLDPKATMSAVSIAVEGLLRIFDAVQELGRREKSALLMSGSRAEAPTPTLARIGDA